MPRKPLKSKRRNRINEPQEPSSGYPDPTAYYGMQPVVQQEAKERQTISSLIHCIKTMTDFAGFEVVGRIALSDKATGKIFK